MRKQNDNEQLLDFARPPEQVLKAVLHFDGGTGPTNPGNGYGSWELMCADFQASRQEQRFGWLTNNEAEWMAFLDALEWLEEHHAADLWRLDLQAFTDSMIVVWAALQPNHRVKAPNLRLLHAQAMRVLGKLAGWKVSWNSRMVNVRKFGH